MSEPPITTNSTTTILPYHHHIHHLPPPVPSPGASSSFMRDYRKGNWTLEETLILITAKRLNEERCAKAGSPGPGYPGLPGSPSRPPGELKWKWVENYCWDHGCYRSQNQCNDKWDNLLRDYKKVRDHEIRSSTQSDLPSYWGMDRQHRKDYGLPSNLLPQIYDPLSIVVQRRFVPHRPTPLLQPAPPLSPPPNQPSAVATPVRQLQAPPSPMPVVDQPQGSVEESYESESEPEFTEEEEEEEAEADGDTKRQKVRGSVGSSIIRGVSILARCLKSSEKKKERRHRELMELEERRLRIEETGNQANLQALASMTAAVNNLSGAIQSLASDPPSTLP